jgi:hypothetical protein
MGFFPFVTFGEQIDRVINFATSGTSQEGDVYIFLSGIFVKG